MPIFQQVILSLVVLHDPIAHIILNHNVLIAMTRVIRVMAI